MTCQVEGTAQMAEETVRSSPLYGTAAKLSYLAAVGCRMESAAGWRCRTAWRRRRGRRRRRRRRRRRYADDGRSHDAIRRPEGRWSAGRRRHVAVPAASATHGTDGATQHVAAPQHGHVGGASGRRDAPAHVGRRPSQRRRWRRRQQKGTDRDLPWLARCFVARDCSAPTVVLFLMLLFCRAEAEAEAESEAAEAAVAAEAAGECGTDLDPAGAENAAGTWVAAEGEEEEGRDESLCGSETGAGTNAVGSAGWADLPSLGRAGEAAIASGMSAGATAGRALERWRWWTAVRVLITWWRMVDCSSAIAGLWAPLFICGQPDLRAAGRRDTQVGATNPSRRRRRRPGSRLATFPSALGDLRLVRFAVTADNTATGKGATSLPMFTGITAKSPH